LQVRHERKRHGCIWYCRSWCQRWSFVVSDGKICQQQWGGLENLFILHTRMLSHCSPFSCAPEEWTTSLFYGSKSSEESWTATSDNAEKLLCDLRKWSICKNTALLGDIEIFHMERIIKKIPTSETRKICSWIREYTFNRCIGAHLNSSFEQWQMFLSAFVIG